MRNQFAILFERHYNLSLAIPTNNGSIKETNKVLNETFGIPLKEIKNITADTNGCIVSIKNVHESLKDFVSLVNTFNKEKVGHILKITYIEIKA